MEENKRVRRIFFAKFLKTGVLTVLGVVVIFSALFAQDIKGKRQLYLENYRQEAVNVQENMLSQLEDLIGWLNFYRESDVLRHIYSKDRVGREIVFETFKNWVDKNEILTAVILYDEDGDKILAYSEERGQEKKSNFIRERERVLPELKDDEYHIVSKLSQNKENTYYLHFVPLPLRGGERGYMAAVLDLKKFMVEHEKVYRSEKNEDTVGVIRIKDERRLEGIVLDEEKMSIEVFESDYEMKDGYLVTEDGGYMLVSENFRRRLKELSPLKKYRLKHDSEDVVAVTAFAKIGKDSVAEIFRHLGEKYLVIYILSLVIILSIIYKHQRVVFENDLRKRRLRIKARKLDKNIAAMNAVVSVVGHDIKGPFTSLLGTFSLLNLKGERLEREQLMKYLKYMESECRKACHFSENLMRWAGNQSGLQSYNPKVVNLHNAVEKQMREHRGMAELKGVGVRTEVPREISCYSDENILKSVIRNLLINGIKFTPAGGSISICAEDEGEEIRLIIEDTGIGIPKDTLSKLRSEVPSTTPGSSGEAGNGMGFLLIKKLCRVNRGRMEIASEAGKGTRVDVYIPRGGTGSRAVEGGRRIKVKAALAEA